MQREQYVTTESFYDNRTAFVPLAAYMVEITLHFLCRLIPPKMMYGVDIFRPVLTETPRKQRING
jgi:hypothetical protein